MLKNLCKLLDKWFIGSWIWNYRPLNKLYFAIVPFITRTAYKPGVYTTTDGFKMYLDPLNLVDRDIAKNKIYEPAITALFKKYLKTWNIFLDIWANIGYYTLLGSKIVGESWKVFAIEPNSKIISELEKNITLNTKVLPTKNITTFKIWAGKGKSEFTSYYAKGNPWGSSLIETKENKHFLKETVKVDRLDDILPTHKIDFIKMDIEWFEREAIQGMIKILSHTTYMIFEYTPAMKMYDENLLNYLLDLEFQLFHISETDQKLEAISDTYKYCQNLMQKKELGDKQSNIFAIKRLG